MPSVPRTFPGRRIAIGFGRETTPGTEVAPAIWTRQTALDFQRRAESIQNNSAMGRTEEVNDSAITSRWADGKYEGKVYDLSIGYPLLNMFGKVTTSNNADASGLVKDHLFEVNQDTATPTLTVTRKDPLSCRRHGLGMFRSLEISGEEKQWVKVSGDLLARRGTTSTDTPAYTVENPFVARHITAKMANTLGGIAAASPIAGKSFKLTLTRKVEPFFGFSDDIQEQDEQGWSATGEIVLRYKMTDYEDLYFNNTPQALVFAIANSDVTIGTSARPSLTCTAPRARLSSFEISDDLEKTIEQTVGFYCELDTATGYALRALLTNTQASY